MAGLVLLFMLPPLMLPFIERMFELDMFEFDIEDMFEFDIFEFDIDMFEFDIDIFEFDIEDVFVPIVDDEFVPIVEDEFVPIVEDVLVVLIFALVVFTLSVAVHPAHRQVTASNATRAKVRRIEYPPVPLDGSDCWGAERCIFPPQLGVKGFSSADFSRQSGAVALHALSVPGTVIPCSTSRSCENRRRVRQKRLVHLPLRSAICADQASDGRLLAPRNPNEGRRAKTLYARQERATRSFARPAQ